MLIGAIETEESLTAVLKATDNLGPVQIAVCADANLGEGVELITGQITAAGWSAGIHGFILFDLAPTDRGMAALTGIGRYVGSE